MSPELSIYGLTTQRTLTAINHFLDTYIEREANEDRGDEELMLIPLDGVPVGDPLDVYEWEPARTLSHVIQRGLDYPRRSFALYLPAKHPDLDRAILKFTTDDQLIFGLSIEPGEIQHKDQAQAKQILHLFFKHYHCYLGVIVAELAPPDNELAFRNLATSQWTVYFHDIRH